MPIPFNPPEALIREYFNRPQPAEIANAGVQQALQSYAAMKAQDQRNALLQQQMQMEKDKAAREGREMFYNYGDPSSLPPDVQQQMNTPAQGPATAAGALPMKSPIIQHFESFLQENPHGIKGREKLQSNRPQQVPNLINGKPAVFNPAKSQYEIAQVVDPTAPAPGPVLNPEFTPRVEPQVSSHIAGVQDGKPVLFNPKTQKMSFGTLPGTGPLTSTTQTEGQANAKLYAQRMEEADKQLNALSARTDLTSIRSGLEGSRLTPNIAKSPNIQIFEQSKRNFLNAVLRRESGAVISPTEFAEGTKQYFPAVGDAPEVLKQKALNRRTAIEGLKNAAGESMTSTMGATPGATTEVTKVLNGKTYIKKGKDWYEQ